jgi:transposase
VDAPASDYTDLNSLGAFLALRSHLDGILSWTKQRVSNGAVEGMNNKIKSISHRSFGFRSGENFIAAIYHGCARLPLPVER